MSWLSWSTPCLSKVRCHTRTSPWHQHRPNSGALQRLCAHQALKFAYISRFPRQMLAACHKNRPVDTTPVALQIWTLRQEVLGMGTC
jgi:hypothetical protein